MSVRTKPNAITEACGEVIRLMGFLKSTFLPATHSVVSVGVHSNRYGFKFCNLIYMSLKYNGIKLYETQHEKKVLSDMCAKWRLKSACAPHSLICLQCLHEETASLAIQIACPAKILIRLRKCAVWSDSSLGAHAVMFVYLHYGSHIL